MIQHRSVASFLKCAKSVLRNGWTQGWFARDAGGVATDPEHPNAVAFCMMGALRKCAVGQDSRAVFLSARAALLKTVRKGSVADFNDKNGRTLDEVLAKYDRAIELAKK